MGSSGVGAGLLFGVACAGFVGAGVYLLRQIYDGSIDTNIAMVIFAPLLLCWIGVGAATEEGHLKIAVGLMALAAAWCILLPLQVAVGNRHLNVGLSDDRIQRCLAFLELHPSDSGKHFELGELYEDRGWLRQAYDQYATCLDLDPKNSRANHRAGYLYEKITHKPIPGTAKPKNSPRPEFSLDIRPGDSGRLRSLANSVRTDPPTAATFGSLAEELMAAGRPRDAARAYEAALQIDPTNDRYRSNLQALALDEPSLSPTVAPTMAPASPPPPAPHFDFGGDSPLFEQPSAPRDVTVRVPEDPTVQVSHGPGVPPDPTVRAAPPSS